MQPNKISLVSLVAGAAMEERLKAVFKARMLRALYPYVAAIAVPTVMWLTASRRKNVGEFTITLGPQ